KEKTVDEFVAGRYSSVHLLYTSYFSAVKKEIELEQLLPLEVHGSSQPDDFTYEPEKSAVIGSLSARFVEVSILHAILESMASEFSSRMVAMKSATENADEMLDKLILDKNRARQAAITTELTEIASGAEALK
ncbi:MAG: FoF1 ATP synthase subunit gamma, partial [bacterium]|nr:FoF1 ATP synthase subunit gamma [bacterium]